MNDKEAPKYCFEDFLPSAPELPEDTPRIDLLTHDVQGVKDSLRDLQLHLMPFQDWFNRHIRILTNDAANELYLIGQEMRKVFGQEIQKEVQKIGQEMRKVFGQEIQKEVQKILKNEVEKKFKSEAQSLYSAVLEAILRQTGLKSCHR